jgi:hypothetical protein
MLLIDTGLLQDAILQAIKDQDLRFLQVNAVEHFGISIMSSSFSPQLFFSMIYIVDLHCTVAYVYWGR